MDAGDSPVDSKSPALIAATSERTDAEDSGAVEAAADAPTDLAPPMDLRTGNDTRGENAVMAESATGGGGGTGGAALAATPPDLPAELEKAEADGEVATADGINTLQEAANNPDEQPAEEKVEPDAAASSGTAAAVAAAAVDSSVEVDPLPASASPEAAEQLPTESEPVDTTLDTAQLAAAAPAAQATGVLVDGSACSAAAKAQDTEAVLTVGAANAAPAAVISEAPAALDTVLAAPAVEVTAVEAPVATVASGARPADLAAADQASALSSPNQLAPPAVESRPAAGSEETAPAAQDVPDHAPSTDHHVSWQDPSVPATSSPPAAGGPAAATSQPPVQEQHPGQQGQPQQGSSAFLPPQLLAGSQPGSALEAAAAIALAAEQVAAALLGDLSSSTLGEVEPGWQEQERQQPQQAYTPTPWEHHQPHVHMLGQHVHTTGQPQHLVGPSGARPRSARPAEALSATHAVGPSGARGSPRPLTAFPVGQVSDAMGVGLATMRDRIKTAVERENTLRLESELAAVDRESLVQARTLAEANAEVERRARLAAEAELAQAVAALQAERARARDVVAQLMAEASAAHAAAQAMERQVVALQAELRAEAGRRRALERQLERQVRRAAGPLQALASLASDPRLLHQAAWQPQQQWSAHNSPASAFGENWLAQLPQPQHAAPPAAPHSAVSPTRGGQTPQRVMQGVREWLAGGSAAAARSDPAAAPVVQPPAAQPAQQASPRKQRSPSPTPAARRQTPQPGSGWEYRPAWRSSSPVGSVTSRPAAPSGRGGSEPLQEQCRQPAQAQHTQPDQELDELSGTLGPQPPPPAAQEHFAAPPLPQQYVPAPACYMPGQAGWSYMASPYAGYETLAFPSLAAPAAAGFPVGGSGLPGAYYGGLTSQAAAPYGAGGMGPHAVLTVDPSGRPSTATCLPIAYNPLPFQQQQQLQQQQPLQHLQQQASQPAAWQLNLQQAPECTPMQEQQQQAAVARPRPMTPSTGRRAAQKHVAGAGRPASPGSTAADLAERGPWHVPGLESVARPRSASSRDKARGLAVPPHRMGEAELAAARAEYAAQTRAIKAKRQREMLDNPQF